MVFITLFSPALLQRPSAGHFLILFRLLGRGFHRLDRSYWLDQLYIFVSCHVCLDGFFYHSCCDCRWGCLRLSFCIYLERICVGFLTVYCFDTVHLIFVPTEAFIEEFTFFVLLMHLSKNNFNAILCFDCLYSTVVLTVCYSCLEKLLYLLFITAKSLKGCSCFLYSFLP